jgi:4-amino-4-deoxy-L-arabinose transferase-like glycosyltransferase
VKPPRLPALAGARVALLTMAIALAATAGAIGLIEPTETRYAEIAREMRASGDWRDPRLDGILHFHKPPLAYWAVAAGFALAGTNEWGARLPAALATLLALGCTALAARRRFASLAIRPGLAVWLLGSCVLVATAGRALASDPFLAAAVAAFWALAPSPWALLALGLGFLAKGPVVFVPTALAVFAAAAFARERAPLALLGPGRGWIAFGAVVLPWYVIVVARTPGLLPYFFGNQLWARYATTEHQRGGPPWYFLVVLIAGALPWTPALIAGGLRTWRERGSRDARLLLAWLIAPLVFFSTSGSKLPAYLLPAFPAAAMLAARGLDPGSRVVRFGIAVVLAALAIAGWTLGPAALGRFVGIVPARSVPLPLAAHVGLACLGLAATSMARARAPRGALLVTLGTIALIVALSPYESRIGSARGLVRVLRENRAPGEPVVEVARFDAGLPFYLGERVRLLDVPRETGFDDAPHRAAVIVTRDSIAAMAARGRVWLFGPGAASAELAAGLGLRYQPTARRLGSVLGFVTR